MPLSNQLLDGGGIRGLSSLEILKRIIYRVGQEMNPPMPDLQPWQYFDLIGGTSVRRIQSTSSTIANMLERLEGQLYTWLSLSFNK